MYLFYIVLTEADAGFPRQVAPTPRGVERAQTYYLAKFNRNLHENEEN